MTPEVGGPRRGEEPPEPCCVPGCGDVAIRSLAKVEVRKAFPMVGEAGRRGPLCRDHYREWKKTTKKARQLDRLTW